MYFWLPSAWIKYRQNKIWAKTEAHTPAFFRPQPQVLAEEAPPAAGPNWRGRTGCSSFPHLQFAPDLQCGQLCGNPPGSWAGFWANHWGWGTIWEEIQEGEKRKRQREQQTGRYLGERISVVLVAQQLMTRTWSWLVDTRPQRWYKVSLVLKHPW